MVNQSLENLSTQTEFENLPVKAAVEVAKTGLAIQNNGWKVKQRAGRCVGREINKLEEEGGKKAKKLFAGEHCLAFKEASNYQRVAEVPEEIWETGVQERENKILELTDAAIRRAGKPKSPRLLSLAERIIKKLQYWVGTKDLLALSKKDFAGSPEKIKEAARLLNSIGEQFIQTAHKLDATITQR